MSRLLINFGHFVTSLFTTEDSVRRRMAVLFFAILLPIAALLPPLTREFHEPAGRLEILERQFLMLPLALILFGLVVRRIEAEKFWKLLVFTLVVILWFCALLAYGPAVFWS